MSTEPVHIGIIGLGNICRVRHVPGFQRIPGVEIVAVANRTPESSARAARDFNIPNICDSWQELVARDDIDAVVIGTWPYMHRAMSVAALDKGKHVFCQARMARNLEEAREMFAHARATDSVAMLCPAPIGLSVDRTVERLQREGFLGNVHFVRAQGLSDTFLDPNAPLHWRKDHRLSGLNMGLFGLFVEVIHRWFGWTESVQAMNWTFVRERKDAKGEWVEVEIPDLILLNTRLQSGAPVQYAFSTSVLHGHDQLEVYGTEATLRYDVAADLLTGARKGEDFHPIEIRPEEAYDVANWRVEQDFIDAIREGKPYYPSFEDGYHYMEVIQAAYDSAALGTMVACGG